MGEKQLTECLEQIQDVMEQAWAVIAEFIDSVVDTCRKVYSWFRDRYIDAGAPYGDTHEGLMRWWDEVLTIARLRQQAEYIEQRHLMLAEIRTGVWLR